VLCRIMVEELVILGSLEINFLIYQELIPDARRIMAKEIVRLGVLLFIQSVRLVILLLDAAFASLIRLIAMGWDIMVVLVSHVLNISILVTLPLLVVLLTMRKMDFCAIPDALPVTMVLVQFAGLILHQDGLVAEWVPLHLLPDVLP